jgi:hypothetical protein
VQLPDRGPGSYLAQAAAVQQAIRDSAANPALGAADREVLAAVDGQLAFVAGHWGEVEALCAGVSPTLVHGDLVVKNVRLRATSGSTHLFALDWETAGWGVPAIDLSRFVGAPVKPDLETYHSALREGGHPADSIEELAHLGSVFRLISAMYWAGLRLGQPWVGKCMVWMDCYRTYMGSALRATRWGQDAPT